jgi:predicted dehydrogenase
MADDVSRRSFLKTPAGIMAGLPAAAMAFQEVKVPATPAVTPRHKIQFAVVGVDHNHINAMVDAVKRGGGELVAFHPTDAKMSADFQKRYGPLKLAATEDEILNDPSIQLILSSGVPNLRAPLGIRAMRHGKDYLTDKPGITSLEQLAEVRKTIKETKRIFAIMYSERLEVRAAVKAGELVLAGAIGRVVQTVNIAPHQVNEKTRPDWFWDPAQYGGILCDIGSHQADQFVYYTGSTVADVTASQIANVNWPQHPQFQDFGDMMMHGNGGMGYVRVDWFTPAGLGTWGDGRLFILGTDGYIELRKYADIAGRKGGNHLFLVDGKQATYMDCSQMELPFGPQFVADIVNRTHVAQDQEQALLAAELVLKAQKKALVLKDTKGVRIHA